MKKLTEEIKNKYLGILEQVQILREQGNYREAEKISRDCGFEALGYGAEGLGLWISHAVSSARSMGFNWLRETPADGTICPWRWTENDVPAEIDRIFSPLKGAASNFITTLKKYCIGIYPFQWDVSCRLLYVLDVSKVNTKKKFLLLVGEIPGDRCELNFAMKEYGWEYPSDLLQFYKVHGGFGDFEDDYMLAKSPCILPPDRLEILAETVDTDRKKVYYDTRDFMLFSPDGAGGGGFFRRKKQGTSFVYEVVAMDHEGGEISAPVKFWDFIADYLVRKTEE